jgi:hypothetical protein
VPDGGLGEVCQLGVAIYTGLADGQSIVGFDAILVHTVKVVSMDVSFIDQRFTGVLARHGEFVAQAVRFVCINPRG